MAGARRSFKHSMGKFEPQVIDKPVAILTAWRGVLREPTTGQPYPEPVRRRLNDKANELLQEPASGHRQAGGWSSRAAICHQGQEAMSHRSRQSESRRLKQLLAELAKDLGKTTRWKALCQEQNAVTDADKIKLAEQVLSEPPTGTVAGGYAQWAKLHGAKDRQAPPYKPTGF
jgi:hypothetical protein